MAASGLTTSFRPAPLIFSRVQSFLGGSMNYSSGNGEFFKVVLVLGSAALMLMGTIGSQSARAQQNATITEAPIVPDRILVLFNQSTLPDNAAARIAAAGGQMVRGIAEVGFAVAAPSTANSATVIGNLRNDPAILD